MTDNNSQVNSIFTDQPPALPSNSHGGDAEGIASHSQQLSTPLRFKFHGNASEYFGIWIVNIVLTIITLSLYSPWAKVRRLRYFYQNTEFFHRRFDFTGVPTRILIGRLIAIGIWALYAFGSNLDYRLAIIGVILLYTSIPWLVRATLRFTARNSKFSNSRFYFSGSTKTAYSQSILAFLIIIFSLGIFTPVATWLYKRYMFDHLYVGQLKFKLNTDWSKFMTAIYIPVFILGGLLIAIAVFTALSMNGVAFANMMLNMIGAVYILGLLFILPWMQARLYIATWNGVSVGNSQFKTECTQARYTWIVASNWVARILTLGLLTPWAAIRLARYQMDSMLLILNDDPDQLVNMSQTDPSALAEEISDIFDFDISL